MWIEKKSQISVLCLQIKYWIFIGKFSQFSFYVLGPKMRTFWRYRQLNNSKDNLHTHPRKVSVKFFSLSTDLFSICQLGIFLNSYSSLQLLFPFFFYFVVVLWALESNGRTQNQEREKKVLFLIIYKLDVRQIVFIWFS